MKVYKIKFNPDSIKDGDVEGVYGISPVDDPAIGLNFIALSKEKEVVKLSTLNEEQRLLIGPVLIPEQRIWRNFRGGCEIFFGKEDIKLLSENFYKNNYHHNGFINHKGKAIEGITFTQTWLVNPRFHKTEFEGVELPEGTWMCAMKVDSDELWNDYVKTGKLKGFSIDAFLDMEEIELQLVNKTKNNYNMKKTGLLNSIKEILKMAEAVEYLTIEVDGMGSLYAEDFSLDFIVYKDAEGVEIIGEQTFVYEGKEFKTDSTGKIIEINDVPTEEETLVEMKKIMEKFIKLSKSVKLEEVVPAAEVKEIVDDKTDELSDIIDETKGSEDVEELKAKIQELQAVIDQLKGEVDGVKAENVEMKKTIENTPAVPKLASPKTSVDLGKQKGRMSRRELFDTLKGIKE